MSSDASAISRAADFNVVFYPFLLGTASGFPWRGRITSPGDLTQTATNDVASFMGSAAVGDFIRDSINLTVDYIGAAGLFDWTFRRMILHYANLCVDGGRSEPVRDRLGASRPRDPARSDLDEVGRHRRFGQCDLGLSDGRAS